jgi:alkylated DNA repair dioxygenase AlkB
VPRDRAETSKRPLPAGFQYDGAVFDASTADAHLAGLLAEVDWEQHEFCIYGRTMPVPRLIAMYGPVAYRYSGIEHAPRPLPSRVAAIRDRIQAATGRRFNAVLLNLYRDGLDGVSWHRDDDYEYGAHGDIASASFGGVRRFQMRDRAGHTAALDLEPGSVLLIDGEALKRWWHRIPKTARPVGPRINLTFRDIAVPS